MEETRGEVSGQRHGPGMPQRGGWSEVAVEQIDKIIQVMAATRGEEPAELSLHTFQRLGIALQRGNAAMMARRMDFLSAEVDGIE